MTEQEAFEWKCYRAIDLIKRIKTEETPERYVDRHKAFDTAIKALEEIQQYRELGTLEELREAREKQVPKKPVKRSFIIPYEGIDVCPNCKEPISKKEHHCNCGQAIDREQ